MFMLLLPLKQMFTFVHKVIRNFQQKILTTTKNELGKKFVLLKCHHNQMDFEMAEWLACEKGFAFVTDRSLENSSHV